MKRTTTFVPDTQSTLAIAAFAIIVFNVTYKTAYRKEEVDERTGMGVEGRVCEESGDEVGLKGERIKGGKEV